MTPTSSHCPFHLICPSDFLCESCPSYIAGFQDANYKLIEFDHIDITSDITNGGDFIVLSDWQLQQDYSTSDVEDGGTYEDYDQYQDSDLGMDVDVDPAPDSAVHTFVWQRNPSDYLVGMQGTQHQAPLDSSGLPGDVSSRKSSITEDGHTCPKCNTYFSRTYNCKRHLKSCLSQDAYPCTFCKKHIKRMDNMKTHYWRQHRSCKCAHRGCQSILTLPSDVSAAACENGHANFVCNVCGKGFPVKAGLDRHRIKHG